MIDLNAIRARYLRICAMESAPSAQSTGAAIAYSLDVPPLLAAIDELEATVTVAESEIAELEAARDRVLALHKKQYAGPFQSTPAGPR